MMKLAYVGRNTAHGTELLSMSCVTAHMYRFSFVINDFLSSGSLTNVNFTSIKSLTFIGFCDTGHSMVGFGFSNLDILAAGDCDGTQKLGNSFSLPFAIFEMADALVLGPAPIFLGIKKINFNSHACAVCTCQDAQSTRSLTYFRTNCRCDDILFGVYKFHQFLVLFHCIDFGCFVAFDLLLSFIFFQFLGVLCFLCDDVL